jgi:hypothetical protein
VNDLHRFIARQRLRGVASVSRSGIGGREHCVMDEMGADMTRWP